MLKLIPPLALILACLAVAVADEAGACSADISESAADEACVPVVCFTEETIPIDASDYPYRDPETRRPLRNHEQHFRLLQSETVTTCVELDADAKVHP